VITFWKWPTLFVESTRCAALPKNVCTPVAMTTASISPCLQVDPEKTSSPGFLVAGIDSPVRADCKPNHPYMLFMPLTSPTPLKNATRWMRSGDCNVFHRSTMKISSSRGQSTHQRSSLADNLKQILGTSHTRIASR
jgi:hypothetical protein